MNALKELMLFLRGSGPFARVKKPKRRPFCGRLKDATWPSLLARIKLQHKREQVSFRSEVTDSRPEDTVAARKVARDFVEGFNGCLLPAGLRG